MGVYLPRVEEHDTSWILDGDRFILPEEQLDMFFCPPAPTQPWLASYTVIGLSTVDSLASLIVASVLYMMVTLLTTSRSGAFCLLSSTVYLRDLVFIPAMQATLGRVPHHFY